MEAGKDQVPALNGRVVDAPLILIKGLEEFRVVLLVAGKGVVHAQFEGVRDLRVTHALLLQERHLLEGGIRVVVLQRVAELLEF